MKWDTRYRLLLIITFCFVGNCLFSQDTTRYYGVLGKFLFETIDIYPDSTFKWTREYDLRWSSYGSIEKEESNLRLRYKIEFKFPKTMSLKDSLSFANSVLYERTFRVDNNTLYYLNSHGRKVRWLKNNFFDSKFSWLTFHYHRLKYRKGEIRRIG